MGYGGLGRGGMLIRGVRIGCLDSLLWGAAKNTHPILIILIQNFVDNIGFSAEVLDN